jgi:hypothetical protein
MKTLRNMSFLLFLGALFFATPEKVLADWSFCEEYDCVCWWDSESSTWTAYCPQPCDEEYFCINAESACYNWCGPDFNVVCSGYGYECMAGCQCTIPPAR